MVYKLWSEGHCRSGRGWEEFIVIVKSADGQGSGLNTQCREVHHFVLLYRNALGWSGNKYMDIRRNQGQRMQMISLWTVSESSSHSGSLLTLNVGYLYRLDSAGTRGKRATLSSLEGQLCRNLCICMLEHWIVSLTSETDVTSRHPENSATTHTVRGSCSPLKCCFTYIFMWERRGPKSEHKFACMCQIFWCGSPILAVECQPVYHWPAPISHRVLQMLIRDMYKEIKLRLFLSIFQIDDIYGRKNYELVEEFYLLWSNDA